MIVQDLCEVLNQQRPDLFIPMENLFIGILADTPDDQICIAPTGGFAQTLKLRDIKYTFQIRVRDRSYEKCYNKIVTIFNLLDDGEERLECIAPSGRKMVITAMQPPFLLGRDVQDRTSFALNIAVLTTRE